MKEVLEVPMTGRLKKGYNVEISTKLIFRIDNYQTVSYPSILNRLPNGNSKIELQKVGDMECGGRCRSTNINDWSEDEKKTIYSYFPNAHIDHLGNVYPSKKEMREGVSPYINNRVFAKFQQLTEMLEWESQCYTMEDADRDGLLGDNEYDSLFFSKNNSIFVNS